jgi:pimeloyl-ACP methyl ester carboxylesterase
VGVSKAGAGPRAGGSGDPRAGATATATVNLEGGLVEYQLLAGGGGRPPMVFLHEGLGSLGLWRRFPAELVARTGRDALVWSRHGYGASTVEGGPWGVDYMHREALTVLPELLDRLGIEAPVLVGHSDGASIALIHAGSGVRAVSGVVALAPHVMVEARTLAGIEAARDAYRSTDLPTRLARHHLDADGMFWRWNDVWLSEPFRDWNIEAYLPGLAVPVLALQCAGDGYGSPEQLRRIATGSPAPVEMHVIAGDSHAPHLAAPGEVTDLVATWLAGLA